ncbi:hypothetical protein ACFYUY_04665 [Kitasatospora sp. NPDC004745]|uniref:hypothetical protein n=1 Tax=Kitasatospora sp. NPDC004745 TaxID=3364019 RepID=UPI003691303F
MMKPLLAGKTEFGMAYDTTAVRVSEWITRANLDYSRALIVSGSPYWLLSFVRGYGETTTRRRVLNEGALQAIADAQQPASWASDITAVPPIVGQQEVMALFGLEHGTLVQQAQARGTFPAGDWHLSGSHLWLLSTVLDAAELMAADLTARPWAPADAARARHKSLDRAWQADAGVVEALRSRTYDGPGSKILPRGRAAKKITEE